MISELIASPSIFKTLFDMAKGLENISDAAARNRAVVELLENISSAEMQQAALIKRMADLEKEIGRLKNWEAEKKRYQLADVGLGARAYTLKPGMENGETPHEICAHCYQNGRKEV